MNAINVELLQQHSPWREKIHFFESIDSTNTQALQLGEAGAPEGTVIIGDEQTSGRGQFQRPWFSPPETGIWMSLLLRPMIRPEMIPALSHFAVVALYDAILKTGIVLNDLKIKEPNDLLIGKKKVAGVLVETRIGKSSFAVVGIGFNILQQETDFPPDLREKVTSLSLATRRKNINRQEIFAILLQKLHERYQQLLHEPEELDLAWKARLM
ncbi:MAG: biotin--[acetyl-CoA-carboxylase] ligase [Chthoniobacterales bacterium]|nr:biotin--[acetyl-CoA-carboxylase] ligase [Chthoniobacterales bacterium]